LGAAVVGLAVAIVPTIVGGILAARASSHDLNFAVGIVQVLLTFGGILAGAAVYSSLRRKGNGYGGEKRG
jgi:hypothetical protein